MCGERAKPCVWHEHEIKTDSMQTGENSSVKIEIDSVEKIPNKRSYHKTIIGEDLTRIFVSVFFFGTFNSLLESFVVNFYGLCPQLFHPKGLNFHNLCLHFQWKIH